jgi:hypothetical protein
VHFSTALLEPLLSVKLLDPITDGGLTVKEMHPLSVEFRVEMEDQCVSPRFFIFRRQSFPGIPGSVIRHGPKMVASLSEDKPSWATAISLTVLPVA